MKGKISHWNDEKGYGFIKPHNGGDALFFHISALKNRRRRPIESEWISYRLSTGRDGKPCAVDIAYLAEISDSAPRLKTLSSAVLLTLLFLVILLILVPLAGLSMVVLAVYVVMSLVTYAVYALDKSASIRDEWRIPENTLHMLSLAGGWPGAMLAQEWLRHKSVKQPFRKLFWVTIFLNLCGLAWLLTPEGSSVLNSIVKVLV